LAPPNGSNFEFLRKFKGPGLAGVFKTVKFSDFGARNGSNFEFLRKFKGSSRILDRYCHDGMSDGKYVLRFKSGKARKAALQQLEFTQPPGTIQAGPGSAGRGSSTFQMKRFGAKVSKCNASKPLYPACVVPYMTASTSTLEVNGDKFKTLTLHKLLHRDSSLNKP